jgi:hypothetical protein
MAQTAESGKGNDHGHAGRPKPSRNLAEDGPDTIPPDVTKPAGLGEGSDTGGDEKVKVGLGED